VVGLPPVPRGGPRRVAGAVCEPWLAPTRRVGRVWPPRHEAHGRGVVGGARSGALGVSAGPVPRRGVRREPAVLVGAAGSAVPQSRQASDRGQHSAGQSCRGREPHAPFPRGLVRGQPPSPTVSRAVQPPAARVVPRWVVAVGHWEARAPASVSSPPTRRWRRRATASALWPAWGGTVWPAPQLGRSASMERRRSAED
jgi:hypothetical protein